MNENPKFQMKKKVKRIFYVEASDDDNGNEEHSNHSQDEVDYESEMEVDEEE